MTKTPEEQIKRAALDAGFDLAGIASADAPPGNLGRLDEWLAAGYHGDLAWMARQRDKRLDPGRVLDGFASMLCVGLLYNSDRPYSKDLPGQPWISRYAWGDDYHNVIDGMLQQLEAKLRDILGPQLATRRYCDTGPVSEKAWAAAAGLGWIGKNTCLIAPGKGSWFFLGEILLNHPLRPDQPGLDQCGTCDRCLKACPTDAFPEPYVLDASRCVSYLTIEQRGDIPESLLPGLGANLYGCDLCQDACPWNRKAPATDHPAFQPRPAAWNPNLNEIQARDDQAFAAAFRKSPVKRAKNRGLKRNAAAVAKNLKK